MSRPVVESTLFRARRRLAEEYEELISGRRCERTRELVDAGRAGRFAASGSARRASSRGISRTASRAGATRCSLGAPRRSPRSPTRAEPGNAIPLASRRRPSVEGAPLVASATDSLAVA